MNKICAKCGEKGIGDVGVFYYGIKKDTQSSTTSRWSFGVTESITKTITTYAMKDPQSIYICDRCAKKERLKMIALYLVFIIPLPIYLALWPANMSEIGEGLWGCLGLFVLSATWGGVYELFKVLKGEFRKDTRLVEIRDRIAVDIGKDRFGEEYSYFTRSKHAKMSRQGTPQAEHHLDQATAYYEETGDFDKALAECDAAIQFDPYLPDAYNLRGMILEELGRTLEAVTAYEQAIRLDPDFTEASENLSALRSESVSKTQLPKCDTCSKILQYDEGYLLTTRQIIDSVESWKRFLLNSEKQWPNLFSDDPTFLLNLAYQRASSDTPWLVCEECAHLFSFDAERARAELQRYRATGEPSSGFAICRITYQDKDTVVVPVDDEGWDILLKRLNTAIDEIKHERGLV